MGSNLKIQHKIKLNTFKTIELLNSETAPLVGLQLGEKNQNFDSCLKNGENQAASEKSEHKLQKSKGFPFHFPNSILKMLIFHSKNFPLI